MKYISYKDLKSDSGVLKGDASFHFKGTDHPEEIVVRGKYYAVKFKHHNTRRDHEDKINRWEYKADAKDPRCARMQLHINNDIPPPKPKK